MPNVLMVIDMLNGFLQPGRNLYCGDHSRLIIPKVSELIDRELSKGSGIIFICDSHETDDLEFNMFPEHCIKGTEEASIISELNHFQGEIIEKKRYSAFFETELDTLLENLRPERLILAGVCTDICVMHTAADARNRDFIVDIPIDCVSSFDKKAHDNALQHMDNILGVNLVSVG